MSMLGSWLNTKLSCFEGSAYHDSYGQNITRKGLPRCETTFELSPRISSMLDAKTTARMVRTDNDVKNLYSGEIVHTRKNYEPTKITSPCDFVPGKMSGVGGGAGRVTSDNRMLSLIPANTRHTVLGDMSGAPHSARVSTPSAQRLPSRLTWIHSPETRACAHRSRSHGCDSAPGTLPCSRDHMPLVNANDGDWQTSSDDDRASLQDAPNLCHLPFSIATSSKASAVAETEPNLASMSTTDCFPPVHTARTVVSATSARNSDCMFPPIPALMFSAPMSPKPNLVPTFSSSSLPLSHMTASHAATASVRSSPGFCVPLTKTSKSVQITCVTTAAASTSVPSSAGPHGPGGWPSSARQGPQVSWPQPATSTSSATTLYGNTTKVRAIARGLQPPQNPEGVQTNLLPPSGLPRSGAQVSDLQPLSWLRGLKKDSCIWSLRHPDQLLSASRLPLLSRSPHHRERRRNHRVQRGRHWPYPEHHHHHHQEQQQRQTAPGSHGQFRRRLDGSGWSSCSGFRCGSSCPSSAGSSRMSSSPPPSSLNNDDDSSQNDDELYHFDGSRMAPAHNNSFDFFMAENIYSDVPSETEETNFDSLLDQCKMPPYEDAQHQQCLSDVGGVCDVGDGFDLMCDISSSQLTLEDDVEPSVASSVSVRCDVSLGPSSTFVSHRSPSPLSGVSHAATAGTHFDSNWPSVSDDDGDSCSLQKEEKEINRPVEKSKESTSEVSTRRQPLPDYQTMTPWTNESLRQASNTFPLPSHEIPCFLLNPNVLEGQEGRKSPKMSPPQHSPLVNGSSTAVTTTVDSQALRQPSLVSRMYASKTPFLSFAAQRLSREKRFRKTAEALQKCGLWDIAMKTGNLVKRNAELQKDIDLFRVEALAFLKSVIRNPENKDLRLSTASTYSLTTTQDWSVKGTDGGESDSSATMVGNKFSSSNSSTTSGYTTCHTGSSIRQSSPSQK